MPADWQLPDGVDRGLWDYLNSTDMVANYDASMAVSSLSAADVAYCVARFTVPGRVIDLGCGTGRLAAPLLARGFEYLGVDLSEAMLEQARINTPAAQFQVANLTDLAGVPDASFDYAACLFSTFGMIRGEAQRAAALASACRVLKPGGLFVLHVHNRGFVGLPWRRLWTADLTMPQAYGGAALTLTHFTRSQTCRLLSVAGFAVQVVHPLGLGPLSRLRAAWLWPRLRAYGYMVCARKVIPPNASR